jgi:hypothetical protein
MAGMLALGTVDLCAPLLFRLWGVHFGIFLVRMLLQLIRVLFLLQQIVRLIL